LSDRFKLVQLLVDAEADPFSIDIGFTGDIEPRSSFTIALDPFGFGKTHAKYTSVLQVGLLSKDVIFTLCSSHDLEIGRKITRWSLHRFEDG
jgi:hypothetical protein